MATSIKSQALKLAHKIKQAYSSFSTALRVAYAVLRSEATKRKVIRAMQRAYKLLESLNETSRADAIFSAFLALLDLPKLPALR